MSSPSLPDPRPRPSACIARSKVFERERVEQLSVEERIRLALGLKKRLTQLIRAGRVNDCHERT